MTLTGGSTLCAADQVFEALRRVPHRLLVHAAAGSCIPADQKHASGCGLSLRPAQGFHIVQSWQQQNKELEHGACPLCLSFEGSCAAAYCNVATSVQLMLRPAVETRRAVEALAPLELTAETEAQWQQLAKAALAEGQLGTAERCYAALGNVAKARYLQQVGPHTWSGFSARSSLSTVRHGCL